MKIGIITLNGLYNFGNRLQNYAVQELMRECGHEPETIIYAEHYANLSTSMRIKHCIRNALVKTGITTTDFYIKKLKKEKGTILFRDFNRRYIKSTTKYLHKMNRMKKHVKDYDYYCAGSDQVWNPKIVNNRDFFFMCFAEPQKTFSVSASMGNVNIAPEFLDVYKKGFSHVGNISVRENDLKTLICDMVGREATLLLDPTFLITKEKWEQISEKPKVEFPEKYIATYFLSPLTDSQKRCIKEFAEANGVEIVDLNGHYLDYIGPAEFIYVISNADFIFTDSFHGSAFSIIFEKKFLAFQRNYTEDMSSRITTVLKTFGMEERFVNCNNHNIDTTMLADVISNIKNSDDSQIGTVLEVERQKAKEFLQKVFSDN